MSKKAFTVIWHAEPLGQAFRERAEAGLIDDFAKQLRAKLVKTGILVEGGQPQTPPAPVLGPEADPAFGSNPLPPGV